MLSYPYYDLEAASVDRRAMFGTLESARPGDVLLLHASCHNPTGADLEPEDWHDIAELAMRRGTPVLIDNAYQGFASGLEADATGIRVLVEAGLEVLIATSFSKNFGLYRDRAGALTICGPSSRDVSAAFTNALRLVRTMYSMPPDHGPAVVGRILTSTPLRTRWETELEHMRTRLARLRHLLADALAPENGARFERIRYQQGMFSVLGISEDAVAALIDEFHIYLPSNGRINVAGISDANVEAVARAITTVARR
jgi:aspartate aminotransferase